MLLVFTKLCLSMPWTCINLKKILVLLIFNQKKMRVQNINNERNSWKEKTIMYNMVQMLLRLDSIFFFYVLFITFSYSTQTLYLFLHRYQWKKFPKLPSTWHFWEKTTAEVIQTNRRAEIRHFWSSFLVT